MFVWFICNTILYNNVACMRLLCSIVYICMYCGIICLLCARLRLWVNSATMRFYGIFAPVYDSIAGSPPVIHGNIYRQTIPKNHYIILSDTTPVLATLLF